MFPFFYLGRVTDNADPESLGRVRVSRMGDEEGVTDWIPVLTPFAGNGTGLFMLPEAGDQVLVLVLDSCGARRLVMGGLWSEDAKPPETAENSAADLNKDGKNCLRFIKSRSGGMFILDDTEGAEKIQVIAPGGASRLEFLVADKKISLLTDQDLSICAEGSLIMQAGEIQVESEKGIHLRGEEVFVSAKNEMSFAAEKDLTIKGSSIALN
ncbi:MAG: phage baseplate assembly protein V [Spirochaetales bacterium]|jgi:uncharacterized protein involved in type VI secretion and phage assembly|nr:phage baseplate assembly protein V [Spirochaetales bacterium]